MKEKHSSWPDDPVVEEVRRIRQALWEEAGRDIAAYIELIHQEAARDAPRRRRPARKTATTPSRTKNAGAKTTKAK